MGNNNYDPKLAAIKELIEERPEDYLMMIKKTEKTMTAYLGKDSAKTFRAQDVLHEVFGDLLTGTRKWDMEKHTLEQVVFMDMRSEMYNIARKQKKYITLGGKNNESDDFNQEMDKIIYTRPPDVEGSIDAEELRRSIFEDIISDDEKGKLILTEMILGKPQKQIASELGMSVEETENHIQKVRRRIRKNLPKEKIENIPDDIINEMKINKEGKNNGKKKGKQ
jgi:RNA polymerase sigma factor (sigma-70 family)